MKQMKLVFVLLLSLTAQWSFAQWYNNGSSIVYTYDKVGIGTYYPRNPLEVRGLDGIRLTGTSHPNDAFMLLQPDVNVSALNPGGTTHAARLTGRKFGHLVIDIEANDARDAFAIRTDRNFDGIVDNIAMVVQPSGNVGIGLTSPDAKLHVNGSARINDWLRIGGNTDGYSWNLGVNGNVITRNGNVVLGAGSADKVGVGTTNIPSGYKLAVDGKVICEELRVKLAQNWPDYVFAEDYELMPLEEVEQAIKENGHLPGIPSAAEVEKEGGIEVGEMQRLMLEKMEEMTLHLIELKKENKQLREELQELKNQ